MTNYDVIIIGAGAAGLMCAIEAGKRGRKTLIIDHSSNPAEKIRISGGGRCNFTNLHTSPQNFISNNPKFSISALNGFTQHDFISLIKKHNISYHEKTLGQLFCDESSKQIINMLLSECKNAGVNLLLATNINKIEKTSSGFNINTSGDKFCCSSLVVACGGKSIPKMGASGFGYEIARQFGINIIKPEAALVPFIFEGKMLEYVKNLAGVAVSGEAKYKKQSFKEAILFTHKGLSGPAILQISSYWQEGQEVLLNLSKDHDVFSYLKKEKEQNPKQEITTILSKILPKRLAINLCEGNNYNGKIADISHKNLQIIADNINNWKIIPSGTEGFKTAEVTKGGVDTDYLSSKTFESKNTPGLYFIGEVVDVTGHLGGFNFQWAWSSGFAAGQYA